MNNLSRSSYSLQSWMTNLPLYGVAMLVKTREWKLLLLRLIQWNWSVSDWRIFRAKFNWESKNRRYTKPKSDDRAPELQKKEQLGAFLIKEVAELGWVQETWMLETKNSRHIIGGSFFIYNWLIKLFYSELLPFLLQQSTSYSDLHLLEQNLFSLNPIIVVVSLFPFL